MKKKVKVKRKISKKKNNISPKNVGLCIIGITLIISIFGFMFYQVDKSITLKNKKIEEKNSKIALNFVDEFTDYSKDELVYDGVGEDGRYNILVIESVGTNVEISYAVDVEKRNFIYNETVLDN